MLKSLQDLIERASSQTEKKRIVIAAAEDHFVMEAIRTINKLGCIAPIFVGDKEGIRKICKQTGIEVPANALFPTTTADESAETAVQLIREGEADILMKGLLPTRTFIRAIVNKENGISQSKILSHLAIFESPFYHKLFGLTDAAMNISPDAKMKSEIIANAVSAFHCLGVRLPKVALLAAVEQVNPKIQATVDAQLLMDKHSRSDRFGYVLEGPLALDLAISSEAAAHKGFRSEVAGDADILIAPDLNSGNMLYKSLTYLGSSRTASVLLGADVPVILTSRADSPESKYYSIALAISLCS